YRESTQSLFIADSFNHRIREVTPDGVLRTVVGGGISPTFGPTFISGEVFNKGCLSLDAKSFDLEKINGLGMKKDGAILFAQPDRHRVWSLNEVKGEISLVAGSPDASPGFSGDGGPATQATLKRPYSVSVCEDSTILISD